MVGRLKRLSRARNTHNSAHISTCEEWLTLGVERGWCSEPVCDTHDGIPTTPEERARYDEDGDPCVPAVRLYES